MYLISNTVLLNYLHCIYLPYSGKLSREKTFTNFAVLWLLAKVFFVNFWGMVSFGMAKVSNPRKFFLRKSYFHQFMKVLSLESFPLYGWGSLAPHKCKNTDCLPSAYPQQRLSDAMLEVLHCVTSLQWTATRLVSSGEAINWHMLFL